MSAASLLPFFGLIRVSGEDRAAFLHGQLSNHIEALPPSAAAYATYNTPKGRVLANMLVLNRGDDLLLVLAQDLAEAVAKRLRMFVLRAKVTLEVWDDWAVAGRLPTNIIPCPAEAPQHSFAAGISDGVWQTVLPHGGVMSLAERSRLPAYDAVAENIWKLHEVRSGYPWICSATSEAAVAQMLNQHIIGGIHFKKGCYPGQEIIARAQYRGQVKRGLALFKTDTGTAVGTPLLQNGEEAGLILNTAADGQDTLALAVVKYAAAEAALTDGQDRAVQNVRLFFDRSVAD